MKETFLYRFIWGLLFLLFLQVSCTDREGNLQNLDLLKEQYPASFFFRRPAVMIDLEYSEWDSLFCRLGGIIGKTLTEEIPDGDGAIKYFEKFKINHPEQMVLLHYNGNSRDPRDESWEFHPSHWLYFEGSELLEDVLPDTNFCDIKVENTRIFHTQVGRYENANEDIGICRKTKDGKPDWNYSEQVQLVSVNHAQNTITVKRGAYGTKALKFSANESLLCPHVYEGPWGGEDHHILWIYNHSTVCPKDSLGNTCNDILSDYLGQLFSSDGKLHSYDGIEFDVLWSKIKNESFGRLADANCDGVGDSGLVGGEASFFNGVDLFCQLMREKLGPDKLILSDGFSSQLQASVKYLNGIESEGWPLHRDTEVRDWSGGWNRHLFWNQNAFQPGFSYVNFKYILGAEIPPVERQRLVWAAAQLMGVKIAHGGFERGGSVGLSGEYYRPVTPKVREGQQLSTLNIDIIDEFVGGDLNLKYWLGKPLGEPVRLALKEPDILNGNGIRITKDFLSMFSGENISFIKEDNKIAISGDPEEKMIFSLENILIDSTDLVISFDIKGKELDKNREGIPRLMNLCCSENKFPLMTWLNDDWFRATFYFRDLKKNNISIYFEVDSGEKIYLKNVTAHAFPDAVYRVFENGLVLANPAHHPHTFNLNNISPDQKYKRLSATRCQDTKTNNGMSVDPELILGEREGLFLINDK